MNTDAFSSELASLSPADQQLVRDYVAFLHWRSGAHGPHLGTPALIWRFNFLEHMSEADVRASKDRSGMEVKAANAVVGGAERPALWQHPPVAGEALAEFHVPVPANVKNVRLRFATGIRDGSEGEGQLVAFRIRADGWQVWSRAAWPRTWESAEVPLPLRAGNVLRIAFATDGLGSHRFAWAAWSEPELVGEMDALPA